MNNKYRFIIAAAILIIAAVNNQASGKSPLSFGINLTGGGRYDNLRMCVGSEAGVKGGPIADIMFNARYAIDDSFGMTLIIPVMRPILFGTAYKMLQFEPEITFEFSKKINSSIDLILGPGLGISLHYGPDYKSDPDNMGDSFFAAGPFISAFLGLSFDGFSNTEHVPGIRLFYTPLFSSERSTGTVLGGVIEYTIYF